jgi:hypothetical protein
MGRAWVALAMTGRSAAALISVGLTANATEDAALPTHFQQSWERT